MNDHTENTGLDYWQMSNMDISENMSIIESSGWLEADVLIYDGDDDSDCDCKRDCDCKKDCDCDDCDCRKKRKPKK